MQNSSPKAPPEQGTEEGQGHPGQTQDQQIAKGNSHATKKSPGKQAPQRPKQGKWKDRKIPEHSPSATEERAPHQKTECKNPWRQPKKSRPDAQTYRDIGKDNTRPKETGSPGNFLKTKETNMPKIGQSQKQSQNKKRGQGKGPQGRDRQGRKNRKTGETTGLRDTKEKLQHLERWGHKTVQTIQITRKGVSTKEENAQPKNRQTQPNRSQDGSTPYLRVCRKRQTYIHMYRDK